MCRPFYKDLPCGHKKPSQLLTDLPDGFIPTVPRKEPRGCNKQSQLLSGVNDLHLEPALSKENFLSQLMDDNKDVQSQVFDEEEDKDVESIQMVPHKESRRGRKKQSQPTNELVNFTPILARLRPRGHMK